MRSEYVRRYQPANLELARRCAAGTGKDREGGLYDLGGDHRCDPSVSLERPLSGKGRYLLGAAQSDGRKVERVVGWLRRHWSKEAESELKKAKWEPREKAKSDYDESLHDAFLVLGHLGTGFS